MANSVRKHINLGSLGTSGSMAGGSRKRKQAKKASYKKSNIKLQKPKRARVKKGTQSLGKGRPGKVQ